MQAKFRDYLEGINRDPLTQLLKGEGSAAANRQMIVQLNGHRYYTADFFRSRLNEEFASRRNAIRDSAKVSIGKEGGTDIYVDVPTQLELKFRPISDTLFLLEYWVPGIKATFSAHGCNFTLFFDLETNAFAQVIEDGLTYKVRIFGGVAHTTNIWLNGRARRWWNVFAHLYCPVLGYLIDLSGKANAVSVVEEDTLALFSVGQLSNGNVSISMDDLQEARKSFPFKLTLSTNPNRENVISLDFMEGRTPQSQEFASVVPTSIPDGTLDHIGFAYHYNTISYIPKDPSWQNKPCLNALDCQTLLFQKMREIGTQTVRLQVPWQNIVGPLPEVLNLDPNALVGAALESAISELQAKPTWSEFDQIVDRALAFKLDVIPQLVQGHTFPGNMIAQIAGHPIAPDGSK